MHVSDILGESIKENPKTFWSYIKKLSKDNVGVSDFEINGKIVDDSKQKAEFLSKTFSSVFTKENLNNIPSINKHVRYNIEPLVISTNGVAVQLQALNPNKSTGPDQIPPWFMKEHANEIAPVLTNIFQESINSGVVPQGWKNANVTAVFKKGKKTDPSNSRFPLLRFRSALHCGYSGITDKGSGLE
jgi:hypothetical protein